MNEHQKRFIEACETSDFGPHPGTLGGYKVWAVSDIVKGGRQQFDGPYFTQAEAAIAAELWGVTSDRRCARAEASIHCAAWNPDPAREIAIRKDAVAARMILAELIGAQIPKPHASRS
ncbi:hypothetical protein IFT62_15100 [Pseudomonas lutea]|uniref:Uncharacterized protein n=1 Tax=Pseudomonas lutea TaxID=243924 RepID=A0ABR9A8Z2_9PSED|nr:hypothetical protein [Pseudomonas lutea]MBD8122549.1 hypothetical protein [Pseudomonas lutea]